MKTAEQIVRRAVILTVLVAVVYVQRGYRKDINTVESKNEYTQLLYDWLKEKELHTAMTEEEKNFFETDCSKRSALELSNWHCRYDCIRPLLWSLGLDELADYDDFDSDLNGPPAVALELNTPEKTGNFRLETVLAKCQMRSQEDIETQAMAAMLWHWRAVEMYTELPPGKTWVGSIRRIFGEECEAALEYIPHQKRNAMDFLVKKKPVAKLGPHKQFMLKKVSLWRHHAFEWILSDDDWDEVSTDT